jgi:hypothetical protein
VNALTLRWRRSDHRRARALAAAVTIAAAAAAAAVAIGRRRRGSSDDARQSWSCDCGQAYLVSGIDRHRVYWLPDAPQSDPLLVRECVSAGPSCPRGTTPPWSKPSAGPAYAATSAADKEQRSL